MGQRKSGSRPDFQAQSAFLGAARAFKPEARHTPRRPCGLSCGLGVSDPSPQAPPFRAGCRFFPKLRTCIHNQRMPDGRGILLPCKAKKRRQSFVYCKIFQRARPAKDPLRRYRMVVNTGSKIQNRFPSRCFIPVGPDYTRRLRLAAAAKMRFSSKQADTVKTKLPIQIDNTCAMTL